MDFDLNALKPEEIIELAGAMLEDHEKIAMGESYDELPYGVDLNELDVDEFLEFAGDMANEMEKEAAGTALQVASLGGTKKGIQHYLKRLGGMASTATGGKYRRGAREAASEAMKAHEQAGRLKNLKDLPGEQGAKARRKKALKKMMARGAVGYGAPAAVVGTGGAYAYRRKKK